MDITIEVFTKVTAEVAIKATIEIAAKIAAELTNRTKLNFNCGSSDL